ncbi:hypothetical protein BS78_05G092200 [Paspalum vaginatum]|nr:hypothetical protein BS78_05G092200 [Paspalum vaginatum]
MAHFSLIHLPLPTSSTSGAHHQSPSDIQLSLAREWILSESPVPTPPLSPRPLGRRPCIQQSQMPPLSTAMTACKVVQSSAPARLCSRSSAMTGLSPGGAAPWPRYAWCLAVP